MPMQKGPRPWLIAARVKRGMTQQQVADAIGVKKAAISRYEVGSRKPEDEIKVRLCRLLGLDVALFYQDMGAVG